MNQKKECFHNDALNALPKIGITTYYRYNYGSILQCYATCEILLKKGYQPCVLEVRSGKLNTLMYMVIRCMAHPLHFREFYILWKAQRASSLTNISQEGMSLMNRFVEEYIPLKVITSSKLKYIGKNPDYIAFLSGSDQIWNGHHFLIPKHHFLRFSMRDKRIAWAPSMGSSDIASYNRRLYKKYISQYASLSVREEEGVELIRELTGITPVKLIDPVFLLDREEWSKLAEKNQYGRYVLCYFLDQPSAETVEKIDVYCQREHVTPILFGRISEAYAGLEGCQAVDGGPMEFVSMIKNADCLFTDSFHGTSFAIILHTKFLVFRRNYRHRVDQSSRLISILRLCHMEATFEPNDTILPNFNFTYSDSVIAEKKIEMLKYLDESIKKANDK